MKFNIKLSLERTTPFYFVVNDLLQITKAGNGILAIFPHCLYQPIDNFIDIDITNVKKLLIIDSKKESSEPFFFTLQINSITLTGKFYSLSDINEFAFAGIPTKNSYPFLKDLSVYNFDYSFNDTKNLDSYFEDRLAIIEDYFHMHKIIEHQKKQLALELKNYTETIDSLSEAIFEIDISGSFTYTNAAFEVLTGYPTEHSLGNKFYNYIYHYDLEEIGKVFYKLTSGQEPAITDKVRGVTKDNRVILLNFSAKSLYNEDGVIYAVGGILQDITNTVHTENRLGLIVDNMNEEIVLSDINHNYVYVSPSVLRNRGYDSLNDIMDQELTDNVHPEDFEKIKKAFFLEGRKELELEYRIKTKDLVYNWYKGQHKIITDSITHTKYLLTVSSDVTLKKNYERQIEILTNNVEDEIAVYDINGNYSFASASLIKNKGYNNFQELKTENAFENFTKAEKDAFLNNLQNLKTISREAKRRTLNNSEKYYEITETLYYDDLNNMNYIISVSRDIESRKKQEYLINENLKKEKQLNKIKSDLITTISHEFRTPLTIIRAYVELISNFQKNNISDHSHIEIINSEIDRMLVMMQNAIMIEKVDENSRLYEFKKVDVISFLKNVLVKVSGLKIDNRKISIKRKKRNFKPLFINEEQMQYAFENLLSNALKYSLGSNPPEIFIDENDYGTYITIKDYGIGIPKDAMNRVFNPFFRASNTRKSSGSGLGLSIVQKILTIHKANIEIESVLNKGTTVIICFPFKKVIEHH
jgi:PAS domain S-box-containing protein